MKNLKTLSLTLILALLANSPSVIALGNLEIKSETLNVQEKFQNWKQKTGKEETWFKAKDSFQKLPKAQQTSLKKKLKKLRREKFLSDGTQDLVQDFKKSKGKIKKELQKKNLSKMKKQALKTELKALRDNLKNINVEVKKDFSRHLKRKLTKGEQGIIENIEPTLLFELQDIFAPNDPNYSNQWGINSLNLETFFDTLPTLPNGEKTIVAMIDAGVDFSHEDLNASKWTSDSCVDENGNSISGGCPNGGYDFMDNDNDPYPADNVGHGTSVASFLGAQTNNNLGMSSASNNNVEIMALRSCCDADGFMSSNNIERAVRFAVNNGAQVINASFGGPTYAQEVYEALDYARENNVLVIAAAGNYATNNDTDLMYPANYDLENIVSVGATTDWDGLAYFSNYGDESVDIAAPGQAVWGAKLNNSYGAMNGTSFSAPMVSAVMSLLVRGNTTSFAEIKNTLFSLVKTLSSLDGKVKNSRVLRFEPSEVETSPGSEEPGLGDEETDPEEEPDPEVVDPPEDDSEPVENPETELSSSVCGNNIVEGLEACDDGNLIDGDGCSAVCEVDNLSSGSGVSITIPVSGSSVGSFVFHHEDHLTGGNIDTDESGGVVQLLDYFPFGDERLNEHSVDYENDYKFTGKEKDIETGLYYYEARYYDSSLGRFVGVDPWDGDLGDPQSLNKYSYVLNNPLKYVDPSGEYNLLVQSQVEGISLATHSHIVSVPDDPSNFPELHGRKNITMGGHKIGEKLKMKINYKADANRKIKNVSVIYPPQKMSNDEFTKTLLNTAEKLKKIDFDYGLGGREFSSSDNKGNCNNMATTLLLRSGIDKKNISKNESKGVRWGWGKSLFNFVDNDANAKKDGDDKKDKSNSSNLESK